MGIVAVYEEDNIPIVTQKKNQLHMGEACIAKSEHVMPIRISLNTIQCKQIRLLSGVVDLPDERIDMRRGTFRVSTSQEYLRRKLNFVP